MITLVDSSAWIESFRKTGNLEMTVRVADLVSRGEAAVAGIIKLELLAGARPGGVDRLDEYLSAMPLLPTQEADYGRAGRLGADLRRQGVSVPASDLLIATVAADHDVPLLSCDRHFVQIAEVIGLRIAEQ